MLSSNGICFSCWIYIKLKNFSSGWIIAKLILQWVVRPCVVMPGKSETTFWFWKFSDCFVDVNSFRSLRSLPFFRPCLGRIVKPIGKI